MLIQHLLHAVLVASGAIVSGVTGGGVASRAFQRALFPMVQGESVLAQLGGQPGIDRMAVSAVGAKDAQMNFRLSVAGHTLARGALEHLVDVAGSAFGRSVLAGQRPDVSVIKIGHAVQPIVAILATCPKEGSVLAHKVGNGRCMTILTRGISYRDGIFTSVAMGAGKGTAIKIGDVLGQAETGSAFVVKRRAVKHGRLPGNQSVAAFTIGAKHGLMFFWLGVASHTFLWCILKLPTGMAAFAARGFMCAGQGKQFGMLGHRKVRHRVHTIVTSQTVGSIGFIVLSHKFSIQIPVAVGTGTFLDGVIAVVAVAVGTNHLSADAANIVMGQAKTGQAVVKIGDSGGF